MDLPDHLTPLRDVLNTLTRLPPDEGGACFSIDTNTTECALHHGANAPALPLAPARPISTLCAIMNYVNQHAPDHADHVAIVVEQAIYRVQTLPKPNP